MKMGRARTSPGVAMAPTRPNLLLSVLDFLDRHRSVTVIDLAVAFGCSERTMRRTLHNADLYGVKVRFVRGPNEWVIEDWGVFDSTTLGRFVAERGWRA